MCWECRRPGNVFRTDGGQPAFIACDPLGGNDFACFGADPCADGSGADRGIQRTPDGERVLVSKDVGADRWAISRNEDGTVTGNVFRAGGGEPAFLACDPTGAANTFTCSGADACNSQPCGDLFEFIAEITLQDEFFAAPEPCGAPFGFLANVTLPADFFQLREAADVVSTIATEDGVTGFLRVGLAPIPGLDALPTIAGVAGEVNVVPGGTNELQVSFAGAAGASTREAQSAGTALVVAVGDDGCTAEELVSDWFEIPLDDVSGQLGLSVSFSEDLDEGDFVLCLTTLQDQVAGQYFGVQQTVPEEPSGPMVVDGPCLDVILDLSATGDAQVASFQLDYPQSAVSLPGSSSPEAGGLAPPETLARFTFLGPFEQVVLAELDFSGDGIEDSVLFIVSAPDGFPPGDVARISFDCFVGVPPPPLSAFTCTTMAGEVQPVCGVRAAP